MAEVRGAILFIPATGYPICGPFSFASPDFSSFALYVVTILAICLSIKRTDSRIMGQIGHKILVNGGNPTNIMPIEHLAIASASSIASVFGMAGNFDRGVGFIKVPVGWQGACRGRIFRPGHIKENPRGGSRIRKSSAAPEGRAGLGRKAFDVLRENDALNLAVPRKGSAIDIDGICGVRIGKSDSR